MSQTVEITEQTAVSHLNFWEKVERVNAILELQEPENISIDSYGGYTGYKPQFIKNAMNEVFGLDGWGYDEIETEERTIKTRDGETLLCISQVEVWIVGVNRRVKAWGQSLVTKNAIGDAHKGSKTDGMKKALSDFSIGSRAFEGKLSMEAAKEWEEQEKAREKAIADRREANARDARAAERNARQQTQTERPNNAGVTRQPQQTERVQVSNNAGVTRQQPARQEPPAAARLNNVPAPTEFYPSMEELGARFTTLDPRNSAGKRITWIKYLEFVFKDEIAGNKVSIKTLLDTNSKIPAAMRAKLDQGITSLEKKAAEEKARENNYKAELVASAKK